jgi:hypothetical protein
MKTAVVAAFTVLASLAAGRAFAQPVSFSSTVQINQVEGMVYLDGRRSQPVDHGLPAIPENSTIRTSDGRVEVQLAPGATLRLGANGSLKLIANRPGSTRLELLGGPAIVLTDVLAKDNQITVVCEDEVTLSSSSAYRFETKDRGEGETTCDFKVYKGSAEVELSTIKFGVTAGHRMELNHRCQDMIPVLEFDIYDVNNPLHR